jgi:hypothetical protein
MWRRKIKIKSRLWSWYDGARMGGAAEVIISNRNGGVQETPLVSDGL